MLSNNNRDFSVLVQCTQVNMMLVMLRRFDSHRGQAYFSSLPGVDIHSE